MAGDFNCLNCWTIYSEDPFDDSVRRDRGEGARSRPPGAGTASPRKMMR